MKSTATGQRVDSAGNPTTMVEAALTEKHPTMYSPPQQGEQYCYKGAKIVFKGLKKVKWLNRNSKPIPNIDGSEDYGNIDFFELTSKGYHLLGYDWGEVIICADPPDLEWIES